MNGKNDTDADEHPGLVAKVIVLVVIAAVVAGVVSAAIVAPVAYLAGNHRVQPDKSDRFFMGAWAFCTRIGTFDKCKDMLDAAKIEKWDQKPVIGWDDVK